MKRIAVSQRVDAVPGRDERRDALDIRLGRLLWTLGLLPIPLCSGVVAEPVAEGRPGNAAEYLAALNPDGILLSGGNDLGEAPGRDRLERAALAYAREHGIPVLGICRGLQIINGDEGGTLAALDGHVAVRHGIFGPLAGTAGRMVNSYHNHGVLPDGLAPTLEPLAWSEDGAVEALGHRDRPWLAIMWHPERDHPTAAADCELIRNHFGETL